MADGVERAIDRKLQIALRKLESGKATAADREVAAKQTRDLAAEQLAPIKGDLLKLSSRDPATYAKRLREFISSADPDWLGDGLLDPAVHHGDLRTLSADWVLPDEALEQAKSFALAGLGEGAPVDAFLAMAHGLCAYFGDFMRAEKAMRQKGAEHTEKIRAFRKRALGAIAPFRAILPELQALGVLSAETLEALQHEIHAIEATVDNRFRAPKSTGFEFEPYRRLLGESLMGLFEAVGFAERRGAFTRTRAAYLCAALVAQALEIRLAFNTVHLARGASASMRSSATGRRKPEQAQRP